MEVGAAKPICLSIPKSPVVCHITPPDDEPVKSRPAAPRNLYSLSSRSPSPNRRSAKSAAPLASPTRRTSFLQDAYRALTGAKSSLLSATDSAAKPSSCLLDVPKEFRNRSKSLDDGTRKTLAASCSSVLDSGEAYKIFESILKEGINLTPVVPTTSCRAPPPTGFYTRTCNITNRTLKRVYYARAQCCCDVINRTTSYE